MDDKTRTRTIDLEPGEYVRQDGVRTDFETGDAARYEFRAAIFTAGEASDGDIIDMRSLNIEPSMPLFMQHMADPGPQLGTLRGGKVVQGTRAARAEAVWTGSIDLGGVGALSEVRQDVAYRMSTGELKRFSGRWGRSTEGTTKVTRRVNLPATHAAFIDASKLSKDDIKQYGDYWEGADALEGSLVGLGADKAATAREGGVRDYYKAQCEATQKADEAGYDAIASTEGTPMELIAVAIAHARSRGISEIEILRGISKIDILEASGLLDQTEIERAVDTKLSLIVDSLGEMQTQLDDLHLHLADEPERVEGEPTPDETAGETKPLDAEGLRELLGHAPAEKSATQSIVDDALRRARGEPTP